MEFRVLGPIEVSDGNRTLPLGGFRQRLVLGALLLHPNRAVTTDWLVDAVWGEAPPRTARKTLQVYISRLRSLLGADAIEATATGYILRLDADALDSSRFEHLADQGQRLLGTDPSTAAGVLRRALSLWRGMPWGEFGDELALQPEVQRLRERRLEALEGRIAADLGAGHAAGVVGELEGLVDEHPWREGFCAQLILALYRSGRQADALRAFRSARQSLGEELGIEPSQDLRDLEERILLQDPTLASPLANAEIEDWTSTPNPYKGLRAFHQEDSQDFFGRADLIAELVDLVHDHRFVALVGASGSGKSSVVMAGLIPQLPSDRWTVATMVPGGDPFGAVQAALGKVGIEYPMVADGGRSDDLDLLRSIQAAVPDEAPRLLLVIDQFEELLHQVHDETVRARFIRNLVELIEDPSARITVLATLRADFFDQVLERSPLGELFRAAMVGVVPLRAHELEAAATGPAERAGVHMEPELIADLVGDMTDQPGALPLFQYVLTQLFDNRSGPVLTRAAYRRLGGLTGALSRRAEDTYGALTSDQQLTARQVFLRLVTVDAAMNDSRRRVEQASLESLDPTGSNVKAVLEAFDGARLLTFDQSPVVGQATVEVVHEALLREWPRMVEWLDGARDDLRLHDVLVAEVAEWETSRRDFDYLLAGSRLDLYRSWEATTGIDLTEPEASYLAASFQRREAEQAKEQARRSEELRLERRSVRRLRAVVVVVSVAALVAAGLTLFAVNRSREAEASQREARARELANSSLINLETDPELAILLALEGIEVTRSVDGLVVREAEEALHRAVNAHRLLQTGPGAVDVAFRPDGTVLSGGDGARLWNPTTDDQLAVGIGEVVSVAASLDGTLLATGGGGGSLAVWDATTGDIVQSFTRDGLPAHDRFIRDVVFSDDGGLLASASGSVGGDQAVRVWDVATGLPVAAVESPEGAMWNILGETPQLAFHPDGTQLAVTGFADEAARILNVASGEWESPLLSPDSPARGVRYFANGSRIATSSAYGSINIWDAATTNHLFSISLESEDIRLHHLDVLPDGSKLAATGDDGSIRVWDLFAASGQPAMTLTGSGITTGIAFSPDGSIIASATAAGVEMWDITTGGRGEVAALAGEGAMIAFSPDGTRLAIRRAGDVVVLDTSEWESLVVLDHPPAPGSDLGPTGLSWSPDGASIVTSFSDGEPLVGPGSIQLWDAGTGDLMRTLSRAWQPEGDLAVSETGSIAAAICQRSANGTSWESPARVWDAASGEELLVVPTADCARAVDLDPEGRLLAVQISGREQVQIWDVETGALVGSVRHNPGSGGAARFSLDGRHLLTAGYDGTGKVWDMTGSEPLLVLAGHSGAITEAIWSRDGETIITGGADGTVRLWDASSGDVRLVLSGHQGGVAGLSTDPEDQWLASSGTDGVVRVWALDLDQLIEIAEVRLSRTLTEAECATYRFEDCLGQS